jgi:hypothetical protein
MPITVRFDSTKKILHVIPKGRVTLDDFAQFMEQVTSDREFPSNVPTLWDLRSFEFSNLTREVMMELIKVRECYPQRDNANIAILVDSTIGFGMGRMYGLITSVRANPQNARTFRDLASAETWLLEDRNSA